MQTLIHADIFFVVTTFAVIFIALVLIIVLVYIAVILADIREISRLVRKESAEIALDLKDIRTEIRDDMRSGKASLGSIFSFFTWFFSKRKRARRQTREEQKK